MYRIKLVGTWQEIQKFLDCTKIKVYLLERNNVEYSLYLKDIPPYINLYENILHIQLGRFGISSTDEL